MKFFLVASLVSFGVLFGWHKIHDTPYVSPTDYERGYAAQLETPWLPFGKSCEKEGRLEKEYRETEWAQDVGWPKIADASEYARGCVAGRQERVRQVTEAEQAIGWK